MTERVMKLLDVCDFQGGTQPPKDEWIDNAKEGYVRMLQIRDYSQGDDKFIQYVKDNGKLHKCCRDDIMLSRYGYIGQAFTGLEGAYNVALVKVIKKINIYTQYLFHYFRSYYFQHFLLSHVGERATIPGFNKLELTDAVIPVPDMSEQIKIADACDRLYVLLSYHKHQLSLTDDLVKSQFIEMFGDGKYPIKKWGDVFSTQTGKLDSNAMVEDGQYPFFTCSKETLRIDTYAFDQEALLLAGNNAAGKYDVKYYSGKFNAYQRTYILTVKNGWSYRLFKCQLENKLDYLQAQSLGGLTKYLTLKILNELEFVVPPIELQNEFAHFVEQTDKSKIPFETEVAA